MAFYIVALSGSHLGSKSLLKTGFTIGRKHGDLLLTDDDKVSGTHAKIEADSKGNFILIDQDSANAILLDGKRVRKVALLPGVKFQIGDTLFRVIKDDDQAPEDEVDVGTLSRSLSVTDQRATIKPKTWKEKLAELWAGDAIPQELSKDIGSFSPPLVLDFIEGLQADQNITLAYGPRVAGFRHLDVELTDPFLPDLVFELLPGPGSVQIRDLTGGQLFINNRPTDVTFLNENDIIRIGQTKIKVRYL